MKNLNLYLVELLSNTTKLLTNKNMTKFYIYEFENPFNEGGLWVLYDVTFDAKCNAIKGASHRMSELFVNILPFSEINN